eukprot:6190268-Pleurochrysis_carterae.AAC.2
MEDETRIRALSERTCSISPRSESSSASAPSSPPALAFCETRGKVDGLSILVRGLGHMGEDRRRSKGMATQNPTRTASRLHRAALAAKNASPWYRLGLILPVSALKAETLIMNLARGVPACSRR